MEDKKILLLGGLQIPNLNITLVNLLPFASPRRPFPHPCVYSISSLTNTLDVDPLGSGGDFEYLLRFLLEVFEFRFRGANDAVAVVVGPEAETTMDY